MSYLRPGRFEIIAHRGGSLEAPENTLPAFEHANKVYPDVVFELDVHCTTDGEIVVFHDDELARVTNGTGNIWQKSYAELLQLDCGYRFSVDGDQTFPWRGKGVKIPKLSEVFEMFPNIRVSVEFKHPWPYFGEKVLKLIREHNAADRVVLAGDDHGSLARASASAPEMCSGFSRWEVLKTVIATKLFIAPLVPKRGNVLQVPLQSGVIKVVTPHFVKIAHQRGLHIHVWTINDEATMRYLLDLGVDGIVTDAPSLLLKVARELKKI